MSYFSDHIILKNIPDPEHDHPQKPVMLTDETIEIRKQKVLAKMRERSLDVLVIYADMEHGSNFEYLVGFLPRFEEALLILHSDGSAQLVLGNENLKKSVHSRISAEPILCSYFSLPDQPNDSPGELKDILSGSGLEHHRVGIAGWKKFKSSHEIYEIPAYILEAIQDLCGAENICNATDIFIGENGVRLANTPNEIAHYEFASSLAGDCMLDAMNLLKPGVTEMEVGDALDRFGQHNSIVTISAFGKRFIKGNLYPTERELKIGDAVSLTVGYRGGCSSRSAAAVENKEQLPAEQRDYFERLCAPYFNTVSLWLQNIHTGMCGGEIYSVIERVLPKEKYHWHLCPGHTTAEEEWMSSPFYPGSKEILKSGMLLQTDIIPSLPGYYGVSVESTCCLADKPLREHIASEYPELFERFLRRREYIIKTQGIFLSEDILPMCSSMTYMRPYALNHAACVVKRN